jgi:hypothetical protein
MIACTRGNRPAPGSGRNRWSDPGSLGWLLAWLWDGGVIDRALNGADHATGRIRGSRMVY